MGGSALFNFRGACRGFNCSDKTADKEHLVLYNAKEI